MSRGSPDWGAPQANTGFILLEDLAELAARLGALSVGDRAGKVFWYDDFRHGIEAWKCVPTGTGSSVETVATLPKVSPYCAKLIGGSSPGGNTKVTKHFGFVPGGGIGAEISIMFPGTYLAWEMTLGYGNGLISYMGRLLLYQSTGILEYQDSEGEYQTIVTSVDLENESDEYHTLKLVVNFTSKKYVRCMLSGVNYDMSEIGLYADTPGPYNFLWFEFIIYSRFGELNAVHLDSFIMTKDEV